MSCSFARRLCSLPVYCFLFLFGAIFESSKEIIRDVFIKIVLDIQFKLKIFLLHIVTEYSWHLQEILRVSAGALAAM